jgi:hypothetical protein
MIAIKHADSRPAPVFHNSLVSKKVAIAVKPLKVGARNTQISLICAVMCNPFRIEWIRPDVIISPGYT